jgi:hypothetical protein
MERSLSSQCILLLPPLVTSANNRDATVFSIFLLMILPQQFEIARSVHLAAEGDVHLAALRDVHLAGEPHDSLHRLLKVVSHVPIHGG